MSLILPGDIIEICCKDLPLGTIFRYKLNTHHEIDDKRTGKLFLIYEVQDKIHNAICIDDGNRKNHIANTTYTITVEIIRYGPK